MLFAQFSLNDNKYVISVNEIVEIIPYIKVNEVAKLPEYIAGIINYRGKAVPVIDLCQLLLKVACKNILSTRILIVQMENKGSTKLFGLLVERATETIREEMSNFIAPVITSSDTPYLGPVLAKQSDLITLIAIDGIMEKLDESLFYAEKTVSQSN
jgi:chemotaxis-related protein WspB